MRKEEVSRIMKAKNDKEFAKMLKGRALGPEHGEMQARLRKNIRVRTQLPQSHYYAHYGHR